MIILYFAWLRQMLGTSEERLEVPAQLRTVRDLAEHLEARGGAFRNAFSDLKRLRAAVNQEHAGWDAPIKTDDEIAFFPPVTGG